MRAIARAGSTRPWAHRLPVCQHRKRRHRRRAASELIEDSFRAFEGKSPGETPPSFIGAEDGIPRFECRGALRSGQAFAGRVFEMQDLVLMDDGVYGVRSDRCLTKALQY